MNNTKKKKVLAVSGSTRRGSTNEAILKAIEMSFKDRLDVHFFDGLDRLPHFNPDLTNNNVPPAVLQFRQQVDEADGVLICTPEYVFSLPGALKNAIEWMVSTTIFSGKPTAMIVASASGEKAFASLDLILTTIEAKMYPHSKLLISGAKSKMGTDGRFREVQTEQDVFRMVHSFIESMNERAAGKS
jgi:NAD(P)H-dependent FMN reductase